MTPVEVVDHSLPPGREDSSDLEMEKDEVEQKLEKVLFGDEAGFHESLKLFGDETIQYGDEPMELLRKGASQASDDENLEVLDDSEVG